MFVLSWLHLCSAEASFRVRAFDFITEDDQFDTFPRYFFLRLENKMKSGLTSISSPYKSDKGVLDVKTAKQ